MKRSAYVDAVVKRWITASSGNRSGILQPCRR